MTEYTIDETIQDILWDSIESIIRDELSWVQWCMIDDVMEMIYKCSQE